MTPEQAFLESSESITGKISKKISTEGIIKVYEDMSVEDKAKFEAAYSASTNLPVTFARRSMTRWQVVTR